uniref:Adenylate isopentenyltransferase n=1 Tax=Oryza brachyantha TaxID=4533 RepID=J3MJF2_ORYBR
MAPSLPPPLVSVNRNMGAKHKAVVVMGATGTGKTRLAVDLALRFGGEVINSDKMQVYRGLDVATNKVTAEECAGVPHHLIGVAHPDEEFTAEDFRREASRAAGARAKIQRLDRLWRVRRVDATEALRRRGVASDEAWERHVAAPSIDAVRSFLHGGDFAAAETTAGAPRPCSLSPRPAPASKALPLLAQNDSQKPAKMEELNK